MVPSWLLQRCQSRRLRIVKQLTCCQSSESFSARGAGLTTPGEIDGATQFSDSSVRCGQFQALAFPRSVQCRSRCHALAGLVRARTSDDIRARAPCTPPPRSFAPRPPWPLAPSKDATRITYSQRRFEPGIHFAADSDRFATGHMRALRSCDGLADRRPDSCESERSTSPGGEGGPGMGGRSADSKQMLPDARRGGW